MRKVILNLAISLDGRIVDENNKFDWIHGDGDHSNDTDKQFDFSAFLASCDTMILGKTAYDDLPPEAMKEFADKKIFVLSHSTAQPKEENVEFYTGDLTALVSFLKEEDGANIWVFGGASVCNILMKADVIEEYVIGIIPMIVGKGTRLFADDNPMLSLKMEESTVTEGIAMLVYSRNI
ncbi:dihydrofolate reductase family protein [Gracilibacillus caseinilyticus]|uniref:Dihydrofolate reductase family protein n=1 Tax=Gracilibacillus caseinilyticus TaxID=2932256 RepID=A0ABY4EX06_9BACI|nr:dihydrofolate reductase family protein [Gracilibacillus caseinilyticus]UOQ48951.1 dihydrofolate reductase family protein [Gracilibacillus caseinilyticus]